MEKEPLQISIDDFNVCFYGGQIKNMTRIVIGLIQNNYLVAWIKFYDNPQDIPADDYDENKFINMNVPIALYEGIISTLRNKRYLRLIYMKESKIAMLSEAPLETLENKMPGSPFSIN
ncbi:hypothetical protein BH10BAC5_BH10BAC5_16810 [soil metagenome]